MSASAAGATPAAESERARNRPLQASLDAEISHCAIRRSKSDVLPVFDTLFSVALGREVAGFDEGAWVRERFGVVVAANLGKFGQNDALRDFLTQTGDRVLVEASPVDSIWGIGLAADHPDATRPDRWPGLNLLGFALMEVRTRLVTR